MKAGSSPKWSQWTVLPWLWLAVSPIMTACSSSHDDPANSVPTVPGNLTWIVGTHEAELQWNASMDDSRVVGYDIFRDGVLIAAGLDMTRFVDESLEPETHHVYSVIAVDDEGARSPPATVELTMLEDPPVASIINRHNHDDLLHHVFDIYSGNAYFPTLATLPDWSDPVYDGLPSGDPSLRVEVRLSCLNGGTAVIVPSYTIAPPLSWTFEFDDCQDDTTVLHGWLHREYRWTHGGSGAYIVSNGLFMESQARYLTYTGHPSSTARSVSA